MVTRRDTISATLLSAGYSALTSAADSHSEAVRSTFVFEANVSVGAPLVIGSVAEGLRRVVPITGGTVSGPRLNGRVLSGGADWQIVRADGVLAIEAKYTLEASDGTLVMVTNRGMRHGPKEVIEKLTRGETVDPSLYYFRTCAEFEAPLESKHAWLNRALFIGVAQRTATAAIVRFHEIL